MVVKCQIQDALLPRLIQLCCLNLGSQGQPNSHKKTKTPHEKKFPIEGSDRCLSLGNQGH